MCLCFLVTLKTISFFLLLNYDEVSVRTPKDETEKQPFYIQLIYTNCKIPLLIVESSELWPERSQKKIFGSNLSAFCFASVNLER